MRPALSLQVRLVVLVLAAIAPLVVLAVVFALREMDAATVQAKSQLQFAASLVAVNQERNVESARSLLNAIAGIPGMAAPERRICEPYFRALREHLPAYSNIGLLDDHGNMVCHARGELGDFNVMDREYFQRAVAQRGFVVGELIHGRATGRTAIPFALPLTDRGRLSGVAFAALDVLNAAAALADVQLPEGARVLVIDRRGQVLMDYPPHAQDGPGRPADAHLLALARGMHGGAGEAPDGDGGQRIFAAVPTRAIGGQAFLAVVSLPRDQVVAPSRAHLQGELALMGLTLAAGLFAAWWLGTRMVVKPAKRILGAARRIEKGKLEARVPIAERDAATEFGRIGHAFNLMAESLQLRQRELEAELGRSRSAYSVLDTVLNGMQEGLVAVDRSGRILMHNAAAAAIFPLEGEVPPAHEWPAHFGLHWPDPETLCEPQQMPFARAVRGDAGELLVHVRNARVPQRRLLRCSFQPWTHPSDGTSGGLVVFTDVTDLENAEADLLLLRNAVARLNDIVLITEADPIDAPGPRIVFVNEAFERLTGYTAREAIGNTPRMLQGPGTDRAALARIRAALEQGRPVREVVLNYTKAGRPLWLELDIVPLASESGRYTHLIAVQRDITGRKAAEQALQELNTGLEARIAERTAELEAFSYSVSHDLRAPLGAIGGFGKALSERLRGIADEKARHYLERVLAGVQKMEQLIDAMLDLSRVSRAPLEVVDVDLGALARDAVEGLQVQGGGRRVEVRIEDKLLARGDARLLRVLMENLVGNAWKFTAQTADARIEVGREPGGAFYVRDNGVGFDMEYAGKLFGAFQRLHSEREFPGTGIGLATVQRIVARHGGRVWAESAPGAGATFRFTLDNGD